LEWYPVILFNDRTPDLKDNLLAKPNYQFEKRQKELEKKKKKEAKLQQKQQSKSGSQPDELQSPGSDETTAS
jgi:hypothetical protein